MNVEKTVLRNLSWRGYAVLIVWDLGANVSDQLFCGSSPRSSARFSNFGQAVEKYKSTLPTGPLRCLATSNSAKPRRFLAIAPVNLFAKE